MVPKILKNKKSLIFTAVILILSFTIPLGAYVYKSQKLEDKIDKSISWKSNEQLIKEQVISPAQFEISPGTGGGNVTQTGPNTYQTDTLNVNIKLQDLNALTQP